MAEPNVTRAPVLGRCSLAGVSIFREPQPHPDVRPEVERENDIIAAVGRRVSKSCQRPLKIEESGDL